VELCLLLISVNAVVIKNSFQNFLVHIIAISSYDDSEMPNVYTTPIYWLFLAFWSFKCCCQAMQHVIQQKGVRTIEILGIRLCRTCRSQRICVSSSHSTQCCLTWLNTHKEQKTVGSIKLLFHLWQNFFQLNPLKPSGNYMYHLI
jgi:hypothetical protein